MHCKKRIETNFNLDLSADPNTNSSISSSSPTSSSKVAISYSTPTPTATPTPAVIIASAAGGGGCTFLSMSNHQKRDNRAFYEFLLGSMVCAAMATLFRSKHFCGYHKLNFTRMRLRVAIERKTTKYVVFILIDSDYTNCIELLKFSC